MSKKYKANMEHIMSTIWYRTFCPLLCNKTIVNVEKFKEIGGCKRMYAHAIDKPANLKFNFYLTDTPQMISLRK